jgi:hypothetical protein
VALAITSAMIAGVLFSANARNGAQAPHVKNKVLRQALRFETGKATPKKWQMRLSSGTTYALLQGTGVIDRRVAAAGKAGARPALPSTNNTQGCQNTFVAGSITNIRVNQDCSRRRQAEETIVANPLNSLNLIAGQNDSRIGYNHCGYDWTFSHGNTWGDQLPPFWQYNSAFDGHTYDACSDPTATFDANGNAYVGGILFDVFANPNAFLVEKSNAPIGGAFYHTPSTAAGAFQTYLDNPPGIVAEDDGTCIFNDKEFIVADAHPGSSKANYVYATWTRFNACTGAGVGGDSPIFFSQSTDGGATWSAAAEISGAAAVCTAFSGQANPNACDQDQGSFPVVGTDGTIYVSFFNGNTPQLGVNQILFVKCPAGLNCTSSANWTAPTKVSTTFDLLPFGPSPQGCPSGRQCIPPNGYRTPDETYDSISVDDAGRLYVVFSDSRNITANCNPLGSAATATPPCDQDVLYATSTNGGASWSPVFNLTLGAPYGRTAQWQPGSQVKADGSFLDVAFYDRHYGNCEFTGCNDITWIRMKNPLARNPANAAATRITTGSMPNLVPGNNPAQAGFLGDYMWLSHDSKTGYQNGQPIIVWADTRGLNGTVEEDVYYSSPVPSEP